MDLLSAAMKISIPIHHFECIFTGGPGQEAHLAPTYAAVNALCILGTEEAFKIIDR